MKLLKRLYETYSPSGKEWTMIKFIRKYVTKHIPNAKIEIDAIGNIYITKGEATSYPCVVAHLDQVQDLHSRDFVAIETRDIIFGYSPKNRRQEGLGADDKNGIWIAMKCLERHETLKVAFFVSEEIGCIGSSKANMDFFENCRLVIQPDRKGYKDLITNIGRTELCSTEFIEASKFQNYGYSETTGMMTDVLVLKERGLNVSCINLSCGYYEAHTDNEFTVKKDLLKCLRFVEHMIADCTETYTHSNITTEEPWIRRMMDPWYDYDLHSKGWGHKEDTHEEELDLAIETIFELLDMEPELTTEDLYDLYQTNFPTLKVEEFKAIRNEYFGACEAI